MTKTETKAKREGAEARRAGIALLDNPYRRLRGSLKESYKNEAAAWDAGWRTGPSPDADTLFGVEDPFSNSNMPHG